MKRVIWIAWIALACAAGCGDAYVAGNYTAALTNGTDGCSIGWTVGMQTTAPFTVTQTESDITVTVTGVAQFFLSGLLGTNTFSGGVDGDDVSASAIEVARPPQTSGGCMFTYEARIVASQSDDTMKGRVEYRASTNDHADCGSRQDCVSRQDFNATRPPPAD
jgi:hypothetical protein